MGGAPSSERDQHALTACGHAAALLKQSRLKLRGPASVGANGRCVAALVAHVCSFLACCGGAARPAAAAADPPPAQGCAGAHAAQAQARSWGDAEAVDRLEVRVRLAGLQRRMLHALSARLEAGAQVAALTPT